MRQKGKVHQLKGAQGRERVRESGPRGGEETKKSCEEQNRTRLGNKSYKKRKTGESHAPTLCTQGRLRLEIKRLQGHQKPEGRRGKFLGKKGSEKKREAPATTPENTPIQDREISAQSESDR